jgi:hypothetical protein
MSSKVLLFELFVLRTHGCDYHPGTKTVNLGLLTACHYVSLAEIWFRTGMGSSPVINAVSNHSSPESSGMPEVEEVLDYPSSYGVLVLVQDKHRWIPK